MDFDRISCRFDFHFNDAFRCFLSYCYADWKTDQITITEFHTSAFISIINQDFVTLIYQGFFDLLGQSQASFILDIDWDQMHIKWGQFFREIDSPCIAEFPFWCFVDKEASVLFHDS